MLILLFISKEPLVCLVTELCNRIKSRAESRESFTQAKVASNVSCIGRDGQKVNWRSRAGDWLLLGCLNAIYLVNSDESIASTTRCIARKWWHRCILISSIIYNSVIFKNIVKCHLSKAKQSWSDQCQSIMCMEYTNVVLLYSYL